MKEVTGDLWTIREERNVGNYGWLVIPICMTYRCVSHDLIMGAGVARQAAIRFPHLPRLWGSYAADYVDRPGDRLLEFDRSHHLIGFPTKRHWRNSAQMSLIHAGAMLLKLFSLDMDNPPIFFPELGCGFGGLAWEEQVKPVLAKILAADNFVVVHDERNRNVYQRTKSRVYRRQVSAGH